MLGAPTTDIRFNDGKKLLEYGFDNYVMTDLRDTINWYIDIPVYKGDISSYVKKFVIDKKIPLKEDEKEKIYITQNLIFKLDAPVKVGRYLGNIELKIEEEVIYSKNIYLDREIKKNNVLDYMIKGLKGLFKYNE